MRKIIQICFDSPSKGYEYDSKVIYAETLHALCDDGTIWKWSYKKSVWVLWINELIPQEEPKEADADE